MQGKARRQNGLRILIRRDICRPEIWLEPRWLLAQHSVRKQKALLIKENWYPTRLPMALRRNALLSPIPMRATCLTAARAPSNKQRHSKRRQLILRSRSMLLRILMLRLQSSLTACLVGLSVRHVVQLKTKSTTRQRLPAHVIAVAATKLQNAKMISRKPLKTVLK